MWEKINYSNEFLDEMLEMTVENYGKEEHISNHDFIRHEYFDNPSGKPFISLAYDPENQKLAGQYVVISQRMSIMGEVFPAILSLNTLTRAAYRGQKVFVSLAENVYRDAADEGIYFCYGAPNQNSHHGFIAKLQFHDIGIMPLWLKVVNAPQLLIEKLRGEKHANDVQERSFPIKEQNIVEINSDNIYLMQDFWEETHAKYPVMVVRDEQFLKWRYLEMPLRKYSIHAWIEEKKVQGYIITRITEVAGMRCGMIVDILFSKGRTDVGNRLIKFTASMFKDKRVSLMGCLMQKHFEEAKCLKKNGFFRCPKFLEPQPFPIIFRKFASHQKDDIVENFDNWYFTMGDYDVI